MDSTNSIVLKIDTIYKKKPNLDKPVEIDKLKKTSQKSKNFKRKIESNEFTYEDYKTFYANNSKQQPFLYKQQILAS